MFENFAMPWKDIAIFLIGVIIGIIARNWI
jgi:hypothetical protein